MGLINRKQTKKYILQRVEQTRFWDCTQVSERVLDKIEAETRNLIDYLVQTHPTRGKRFDP